MPPPAGPAENMRRVAGEHAVEAVAIAVVDLAFGERLTDGAQLVPAVSA